MYYLLIDSDGASLDSFEDRDEAIGAWEDLVRVDRAAEDEVAVLECESDGTATANVTPGTHSVGVGITFPTP